MLAVRDSGDRPGAGEDDLRTFKRRKQEVEKESKVIDDKRSCYKLEWRYIRASLSHLDPHPNQRSCVI
ncbi:hypothetical protein AN958_01537 [Leucoagaricus sp. SymC.cos]|nr:hypothetical protein AN958_01537 [Leucoagaricus sp. SymC.cos]